VAPARNSKSAASTENRHPDRTLTLQLADLSAVKLGNVRMDVDDVAAGFFGKPRLDVAFAPFKVWIGVEKWL
jgi:hypothetical protein